MKIVSTTKRYAIMNIKWKQKYQLMSVLWCLVLLRKIPSGSYICKYLQVFNASFIVNPFAYLQLSVIENFSFICKKYTTNVITIIMVGWLFFLLSEFTSTEVNPSFLSFKKKRKDKQASRKISALVQHIAFTMQNHRRHN